MGAHEPGRDLRVHQAPPHVLTRAMAERSLRSRQRPRTFALVAATGLATLALGLGVGLLAGPTRTQPVHVEVAVDAPLHEAVPVKLVYHSETARSVAVAGSFNDWDPATTAMERVEGGLFRATIFLERGRHEYMFVVDGERWVTDVSATTWQDDGFGNRNAVLEL